MTASSNRLGLASAAGSVALGLALAFALVGATPAAAQDSGPLLLTPWPSDIDPTAPSSTGSGGIVLDPTQPGATGATTSPTTPPTPTSTQPTLPPAPEGERAPEGITVNALEDISTDYGGTLEPIDGGLGYDMWAGTDRAAVELLLPQVPIQPLSPAMRDLARRLLLSTAEPPVGTANQKSCCTVSRDWASGWRRPGPNSTESSSRRYSISSFESPRRSSMPRSESEGSTRTSILEAGLRKLKDSEKLLVRVAPADLRAIEELLPVLKEQNGILGKITLREDPEVSEGGCVLESDQCEVDGRIEVALRAIEEALKRP